MALALFRHVWSSKILTFVHMNNKTRKEQQLQPHRFADLYHSANRTPVSTSEDWFLAEVEIDVCLQFQYHNVWWVVTYFAVYSVHKFQAKLVKPL